MLQSLVIGLNSCFGPPSTVSPMDLYEIRDAALDVISEEAEHQELGRSAVESRRATRAAGTFQRFSVNTNESLSFEPCGDSSPSPTGADIGDDDDVFREGDTEVSRHP